ncbi:hypothetical protein ONZ43_g3682 [Nemania bipapillata]|uniref:Uncharacterized protein n=1 Tax=Nemania bipapillata TaxID=110536 RepID=A0ACC2IW63_9PEZI|nr:hypothetical protein ONZ43_g3682 [Nemania bipapillata]
MKFQLVTLLAAAATVTASPWSNSEVEEVVLAMFKSSDAPSGHEQASTVDFQWDPESVSVESYNPLANTREVCFWSGTAPFCEGACPNNWSEKKKDKCGDGSCCVTGKKSQCCRTFNLDNCYWSGTAPLCSGSCNAINEYELERSGCGDGECCLTGSKAKCCKPA